METFTNLPISISEAISTILSRSDLHQLSAGAKRLHERYMNRVKGKNEQYVQNAIDMLSYLCLRAPATYAQISGALLQVRERIPDWKPVTMLDLGCGPGTGMWAAKTVFPSINSVHNIDQEKYFLSLAEEIAYDSHLDLHASYEHISLTKWIETSAEQQYDLIIVANVCNELPDILIERVINQVSLRSNGIVMILEPGSSIGYPVIQKIAENVSQKNTLIAPYIHNSFVRSDDYWIHFPQRFQRPEFQRRIRQSMRESDLMASDWEEAKYSYVAWGNIPVTTEIWGQCIGYSNKQKGFLTIPLLTEQNVTQTRILKRHKEMYNFARDMKWGQIIHQPLEAS